MWCQAAPPSAVTYGDCGARVGADTATATCIAVTSVRVLMLYEIAGPMMVQRRPPSVVRTM